MAAYYHGGAGTDIQSGTDGLQTLYLMNPSYAGYGDAAAAPGAAANMMLLNSAVTSMTPAPPASGYNLWTAGDEGKYLQAVAQGAASQGQMVMSSKYLKAAQELLDEVVSVSKGVDDVKAAAAAKSPASVKKKEDSAGDVDGGAAGAADEERKAD
uniref:POX domain-containing protein n=1 Tax=Oryza barthii TaxID=65489 RepID=A0A0D3HIH5_9ORYZ